MSRIEKNSLSANTNVQFKALGEALQNYPDVQFADLFGSQAMGRVTSSRDVDIAVYRGEVFSEFDKRRLVAACCDAFPNKNVNLFFPNDTNILLRYQVFEEWSRSFLSR